MEVIRSHVTDAEEEKLVDVWYRRDTNAIPPVYVLQNIDKDINGG